MLGGDAQEQGSNLRSRHASAKMILLKDFRLVDECSEDCENDPWLSASFLSLDSDVVSTLLLPSK